MIDYKTQFWLDLAEALKDPEFREAFFGQLEEMRESGKRD